MELETTETDRSMGRDSQIFVIMVEDTVGGCPTVISWIIGYYFRCFLYFHI